MNEFVSLIQNSLNEAETMKSIQQDPDQLLQMDFSEIPQKLKLLTRLIVNLMP